MEIFDEKYFRNIFDTYFDEIYSGFLYKTHNEETAQDLTQLTFIKFWEYRYSYSFELSPKIQLYRKAKLIFIDWLRKEAHQRKLMEEIKNITTGSYQNTKFELTDSLSKAIEKLPPTRQKVFMMAYVEGFSHKEIARMLNISVKTVDAHILKALHQLRKELAYLTVCTFILGVVA